MDDRLGLILVRLTEAIDAKDWDVGFWRWHRDLSRWLAMKYPMRRERRVNLLRLYFELAGGSMRRKVVVLGGGRGVEELTLRSASRSSFSLARDGGSDRRDVLEHGHVAHGKD